MVNLTDGQAAHLAAIRNARAAEAAAIATAEARHRAALEAELSAVRLTTALAVRRAADAGVPLRRIGRDGLNTSSWETVRAMLALTDDTPAEHVAELTSGMRRPSGAERAAAGIDASEDAVHIGDRIAVRIPDMEPPAWAAVTLEGRPAGQVDADTAARLAGFTA